VRQAVDQLEDAIANLRALITDLRPAALDELGVQAAVEGLAERSIRHGLEVDVSVELAYEQGRAATRHAPELETAIYRIVQESLTNASKHGAAKRAVVEIHERDATIHISVRDDGSGFDIEAETDGFGLLGMRERVELLGGGISIDSAPGNGATVAASIPVPRAQGERIAG
jgi:signal transduction histidine kinase